MNAAGYLGRTGWRLPIILDTTSIGALEGFNSDPSRSELAHLFYVTLGNVANVDENGNPYPDPGLSNTALFSNLQPYYYWTGNEYDDTYAWAFAMHNGDQYRRAKVGNGYPFPVLDGDVGTAVHDGDINNDGAVDAGDLVLAMRILLNEYTPTPTEQSRWDVAPLVGGSPAPDGRNDIRDYLVLRQKVFGMTSF
jgi:hypothetical protein